MRVALKESEKIMQNSLINKSEKTWNQVHQNLSRLLQLIKNNRGKLPRATCK
jgi:hypothetical protein